MTGDASRGATPRGRCIPRGHPISGGPAHYGTDEIALDRLVGRAATLDSTSLGAGDLLDVEKIRAWEEEHGPMEAGNRVLVRYGWDLRWPPARRGGGSQDRPGLGGEAAEYLVEKEVALVGCDTLAVDAAGSQENPAHHALLGNEVYVVENLNRLPPFCPFVALPLVALPLKIRGGSGSPVRTVTLLLGR